MVFDPEMAAGLLRHLAAAVSGYALYKGTSFLIGKLGERIAPEFVTVVDDGTLPGGARLEAVRRRGPATRRTVVVDRGVLTNYLFDTYSARKLKSHSTGNAARSVGSAPQVAPTNFVLQAGTASPAEIISSVQSGLYVTELIGFGVNPGHRRLLARCRRAVDRERRVGLPGRGDHHRRQPAGDVRQHRGHRQRSRHASRRRSANDQDRAHDRRGELTTGLSQFVGPMTQFSV